MFAKVKVAAKAEAREVMMTSSIGMPCSNTSQSRHMSLCVFDSEWCSTPSLDIRFPPRKNVGLRVRDRVQLQQQLLAVLLIQSQHNAFRAIMTLYYSYLE